MSWQSTRLFFILVLIIRCALMLLVILSTRDHTFSSMSPLFSFACLLLHLSSPSPVHLLSLTPNRSILNFMNWLVTCSVLHSPYMVHTFHAPMRSGFHAPMYSGFHAPIYSGFRGASSTLLVWLFVTETTYKSWIPSGLTLSSVKSTTVLICNWWQFWFCSYCLFMRMGS